VRAPIVHTAHRGTLPIAAQAAPVRSTIAAVRPTSGTVFPVDRENAYRNSATSAIVATAADRVTVAQSFDDPNERTSPSTVAASATSANAFGGSPSSANWRSPGPRSGVRSIVAAAWTPLTVTSSP
jgi:hypothetical protein